MSNERINMDEIILRKLYMRYDGSRLVDYIGTKKNPTQKCFTATLLFDKSKPEHMEQLKELTALAHKIRDEALNGKRLPFSIPIHDNANLPDNFIPEPEEVGNYYRVTLKAKAKTESEASINAVRPVLVDRFGKDLSEDFVIPAGACVTAKLRWYTYSSVKEGMTFVPLALVYHDNIEPAEVPAGNNGTINREAEKAALKNFFDKEEDITLEDLGI